MDNQQDNHIKLLNPLTLAYMGDAVLDQYVRTYIVLKLKSKPNKLHQMSKKYVSAKSQAQTLEIFNGARMVYRRRNGYFEARA